MLGSGNPSSRGSAALPPDMSSLPQYLPLDPITLGSQRYPRSGELRRVLGVPYGSMSQDHSFGVSQQKPSPPPVATEELKHFKESVQDSTRKARDRVKNFRDKILKLDKYRESLNSKKRQRIDVSPIDRSSAADLTKMGSQIQRNSQDLMNQRLEDRTKSVGVNKRVRTSVADVRLTDGRAAATSRQQLAIEKDGDMLPAVSGATIKIEEKIRRLPVGGEGWDKKMKRKRSVASVGNRVMNSDQDTKQAIQPKMNADSKLRSCDAQVLRSKSSLGVTGINKLDGSLEPASSDAGSLLKTELEGPPLRDRTSMLEQRVVAKGKNKPNIREDNPGNCSSTMLKGKVSAGPRTGSIMVLDSSSKVHSSPGTFQGWEQPTSVNKVPSLGVTNYQKRPLSASSSHAMAQWVGQRPHKNSRTRRANLVSPVSKNEVQPPSQGFSASDFGAKTSAFGTNGSLLSSSIDNNTPKIKREFENVSSPFGFSESEESGAGDNKLKEKEIQGDDGALSVAHKVRSFTLPRVKNKILTSEIGDGVRIKGRSVSGSLLTRPSIHMIREKLENVPTTKPLQSMRPTSDKIKSKTGRPPSKKLKDRKASVRVGLMLNNVTPNFASESDDDHEDLFAAADSARNASSLACSGTFWKKMKYIFSSLSLEDVTYFKQQLSFSEELEESLSQMFGYEYNLLGILVHKDLDRPCEGKESRLNEEKAMNDGSCARFDMGRLDKVTPLYQRVLSALIEEDEAEEFYHHSEGKNLSFHYASDDSHCGSCNQIDIDPKDRDRMESEVESEADFHSQKNCLLDRLSCNKSAVSNAFRNPSMSSSLQSNEQWLGDDDVSHSDVGLTSEICSNDLSQTQPREINVPAFPSSDCQYQLMSLDDRILLELQSIGLYPETLPGLSEGEEVINQDVMELKEELRQQIKKKKKSLRKLDKAIQKGRDVERRNIEHCAMDQLIEIAYRKRMACRGNHTSKGAVRKVSRQVAIAFIKRTLARCRKFEDTGSSCFSEPALQDVLFSAPPCSNDAKSADCVGSGTASNTCNEVSNHQTEAKGSGAVSSTFKRYDTPSDNLDRGSSDAFPKHGIILKKPKREVLIDDVVGSASSRVTSTLDNSNLVGGARGKRNEKDRDYKTISVSVAGRSSLDNLKNERKTKVKTKHKDNHSVGGRPCVIGSNPSLTKPSNGRGREVGLSSPGKIAEGSWKVEDPVDFSNLQLNELDPMALDVSNDLGAPQDLNSWLNFDGLQDHDSVGLEIPMDDLTDLNMLM
ncbi:uncharacterized protein LOC123209625 [Mangifera indica]|uniref:uncharacterized protein LOC123209625 n=1 Tax=Mangifera indica TaxID=29780 RepID=UPI001CF9F389|nr:uncharacterized protein LOC123209625 [Mangifera indica]